MRKPFVIGLTGGIGSGKSALLADLVSLGAEGIDADQVARAVTALDGPAYASIVAEFGSAVLAADGAIDRKRLGEKVFADPTALAKLEGIIHPAVYGVIAARVAASQAPVVVIEAIKLLEAGLSRRLCDEVWVTRCTPRQQIARLRVSRGMSLAEARRRMAAQMPTQQMISQAHRVIDTSGSRAAAGIQALAAWIALELPLPRPIIRPGSLDDAEAMATVLNSVVREGGWTILDRTLTAAQQRAFLRQLPARARQTLAQIGKVVVGFQFVEPYAQYTGAMDHVATVGSYVIAPLRGRGLGAAMSRATFAAARELGFSKLVITVRADNPGAQAFYGSLGFRPCGRLARQAFVDGRYVDELMYELFLEDSTKDG